MVNDVVHWEQLKGFSRTVWMRRCAFKCFNRANDFEHSEQLKCFTPWLTLKCNAKLFSSTNFFEQSGQLKNSSPPTTSWVVFSSLVLKIWNAILFIVVGISTAFFNPNCHCFLFIHNCYNKWGAWEMLNSPPLHPQPLFHLAPFCESCKNRRPAPIGRQAERRICKNRRPAPIGRQSERMIQMMSLGDTLISREWVH